MARKIWEAACTSPSRAARLTSASKRRHLVHSTGMCLRHLRVEEVKRGIEEVQLQSSRSQKLCYSPCVLRIRLAQRDYRRHGRLKRSRVLQTGVPGGCQSRARSDAEGCTPRTKPTRCRARQGLRFAAIESNGAVSHPTDTSHGVEREKLKERTAKLCGDG